MVPFINFNITPAAFGQIDPATVLNAYNLFPSTIAGYSISQNIECVKYNIDGNKACSIVLTSNGVIHSINIQVASYVNKKMFIFTMQATPYDFNNYLPVFQNIQSSCHSREYYHLSDQNSHYSQSNNDPKNCRFITK
jgi:hypothetical protein